MAKKKQVNYFDDLDNVRNNENLISDDNKESKPADDAEANGWIPFKRRKKYQEEEYLEQSNGVDIADSQENQSAELLHDEDFEAYWEQLSKEEQEHYNNLKGAVDKNVVQRKKFYGFLISIVIVLAIVFSCYQFLRAENIVISGTETISGEYILGLSGVKKGQHFLTIDRKSIINNLEKNPYIKVNRVYFTFPNTLRINLTERKPAGVIGMGTQYIVLDKEAFILSVTNDISSMELPLIKGLGIKLADIGAEIRTNDDTYKLVVAKDVMYYLELNNMTDIVSVADLTDINAIVLYVTDGIKLKIGQGDRLNSKLAWANAIIKTLKEEGTYSGIIDVSTEGAAVYEKEEGKNEQESLTADSETEDGI